MPLQTSPLVSSVLGSAINVHKSLGPGLFESVYKDCLIQELERGRIRVAREVALPLVYQGTQIERGFRLDMVVEDCLVLEIKSVEHLLPVHFAQILTYLRLSGLPQGLLINFNVTRLKDGVRSLSRAP